MLYNKIRAGKSYFINPLSRVELRERKKSTCTGCNEPRKTARCMNRSHRESLLLLLLLLPHSMRATTTGRHPRGGSERERREAQSIVADAKVKNTPSPQAIDSYIHFAFYSYCIYTQVRKERERVHALSSGLSPRWAFYQPWPSRLMQVPIGPQSVRVRRIDSSLTISNSYLLLYTICCGIKTRFITHTCAMSSLFFCSIIFPLGTSLWRKEERKKHSTQHLVVRRNSLGTRQICTVIVWEKMSKKIHRFFLPFLPSL